MQRHHLSPCVNTDVSELDQGDLSELVSLGLKRLDAKKLSTHRYIHTGVYVNESVIVNSEQCISIFYFPKVLFSCCKIEFVQLW